MTRLFASSFLLASFAIAGALYATARAQAGDMFALKSAAQQRANRLKCSGVFQMGDQWMPCANERALHDALQRQ